jgi:hypothetical protein
MFGKGNPTAKLYVIINRLSEAILSPRRPYLAAWDLFSFSRLSWLPKVHLVPYQLPETTTSPFLIVSYRLVLDINLIVATSPVAIRLLEPWRGMGP